MIDDEAPTPRPWAPDPRLIAADPLSLSREAAVTRADGESGPRLDAPERPEGPGSQGHQPWEPVAGPADRVSFFAEQARRRRATWQLAAAATLAVILAGLPLSLVVTPLVFLAIIVLTKLASLVVPLSPAVPALYRSVAGLIGSIMDLVEASDKGVPLTPLIWPSLGGWWRCCCRAS
jgi:hypothetical protein